MDIKTNKDCYELWHGGKNLEFSYKENLKSKTGRFEYGPGLYLTTHYETAKKYSKGGGKTYKVMLKKGVDIKNVTIHLKDIVDYISTYVSKNKQKDLFIDIYQYVLDNKIKANIFLNLILYHNAVKPEKSIFLMNFLVDNGIDYAISENYNGRKETIVVVFNKEKINNINIVRAKNVNLRDYELSFDLTNNKKILM